MNGAPIDPRHVLRDAEISPCGLYRYRLTRRWGDGPPVAWIMLNPSTADHAVDDPTVRRCMSFAHRWGYRAIDVVNLFAYRTPHPEALRAHTGDRVGPLNEKHLRRAIAGAPIRIAAWGNHGDLEGRATKVYALARTTFVAGPQPLSALAVTRTGAPRHPMARGPHWIPDTARPRPWRPA